MNQIDEMLKIVDVTKPEMIYDALPALSGKLSNACELAREDLAEYFRTATIPEAVVSMVNQLEYAAFLLNLPVDELDPEVAGVNPVSVAAQTLADAITEITRLSVEISRIRDQVPG